MGMYDSWNKRLAKASELHKEKKLIWWRRGPYRGDYVDQIPKWHIFKDRTPIPRPGNKGIYHLWEARCGYTKSFDEMYFLECPQLNLSKRPPIKPERCTKCVRDYGQDTK